MVSGSGKQDIYGIRKRRVAEHEIVCSIAWGKKILKWKRRESQQTQE